jgi:hypothetical protein
MKEQAAKIEYPSPATPTSRFRQGISEQKQRKLRDSVHNNDRVKACLKLILPNPGKIQIFKFLSKRSQNGSNNLMLSREFGCTLMTLAFYGVRRPTNDGRVRRHKNYRLGSCHDANMSW